MFKVGVKFGVRFRFWVEIKIMVHIEWALDLGFRVRFRFWVGIEVMVHLK